MSIGSICPSSCLPCGSTYRLLDLISRRKALTGVSLRFLAPEVGVIIAVELGTHLHAELSLLKSFLQPPLKKGGT